jgi:hypothetical protein
MGQSIFGGLIRGTSHVGWARIVGSPGSGEGATPGVGGRGREGDESRFRQRGRLVVGQDAAGRATTAATPHAAAV